MNNANLWPIRTTGSTGVPPARLSRLPSSASSRLASVPLPRAGRLTLLSEGTVKYDPNYDSTAFGLLGASNSYSGGGSSEDKRLDSMLKYSAPSTIWCTSAPCTSSTGPPVRPTLHSRPISEVNSGRIDRSLLFEGQRRHLGFLAVCGSSSRSAEARLLVGEFVAATISDNTTFAVMAFYQFNPLKFFAGYEHIRYANPTRPLDRFTDIGGYILAFVSNSTYDNDKVVQVYWTGFATPSSRPSS